MNRSAKFATACVVGGFLALGAFGAAGQKAKPEEEERKVEAPVAVAADNEPVMAPTPAIDEAINRYDLSPQPLPEIPDNPPPHEGAMIDQPPYRIEPPDLVLVEVLEALPGRPITGERLVRPDGMITLGFYGAINVRGLTIEQVKVKIIKHLRTYLSDGVLGLYETTESFATVKDHGPVPKPPDDEERSPFELPVKPKGVSNPGASLPVGVRVRSVSDMKHDRPIARSRPRNTARFHLVRGLESPESQEPRSDEPTKADEEPVTSIKIPLEGEAEVPLRIEIKKEKLEAPTRLPSEIGPDGVGDDEEKYTPIPPQLSERVFVDVTAYNSKNYYVLGHVGSQGKLPINGKETVLDALNYAGNLLTSADPRDIRLVRPGRDGKPGKVYKVDLEAIRERGETATNYQVFPDDRIYVGANELARTKYQIEQLSAQLEEKTLREKLHAKPDAPKADK
ncbi:MAG: polysaccharide biosynthesis/export family protein [Paludisphaera borealis]|uniref:polysaccharide biosynthesis/export family protein n=1 Tax=Paludisphaera borealis TaxID=1387353 RepID=UPI002842FB82|nr:polysaccharide biosynthesis/export family protein [Paludisphaera borealis]MDR3618428.1 polysaccharide biosynthesis/export family protein [Paludisphaera borealis]